MINLKINKTYIIFLLSIINTTFLFSNVDDKSIVDSIKGDDTILVQSPKEVVYIGLSQNVVNYLESQNLPENLANYLNKKYNVEIDSNQAQLLNFAAVNYGLQDFTGDTSNTKVLQFFSEIGHPEVVDDETSWCSAYMSWCAKNVNLEGLEVKTNLSAKCWLQAGEEVIGTPKTGDIVIFWREKKNSWQGHVSIFINEDPVTHQVFCLGGNQDDKVCIKAYPSEQVLGFRRLKIIE